MNNKLCFHQACNIILISPLLVMFTNMILCIISPANVLQSVYKCTTWSVFKSSTSRGRIENNSKLLKSIYFPKHIIGQFPYLHWVLRAMNIQCTNQLQKQLRNSITKLQTLPRIASSREVLASRRNRKTVETIIQNRLTAKKFEHYRKLQAKPSIPISFHIPVVRWCARSSLPSCWWTKP